MVPETTHNPPGGAGDDDVETEPVVTVDSGVLDAVTDPLATDVMTRPEISHGGLDSIERTVLQARIAALERALEAKDRERAAIIDQYEAILDERDRARDGGVAIEFEDESDGGLLGRLRARLQRR